jgi:uncharacterized protein
MESKDKALLGLGVILATGILASALVVAKTFYDVRALGDALSVTGSARLQVTSDRVKWSASFTRNALASDLNAGYEQLKQDETVIRAFLESKGVPADAVTISPVSMGEIYKQDWNAPKEYFLRQGVEVRSDDVANITAVAKDIQPVIQKGVIFSSDYLEYTYSKLPDLRVSLLSDAVKDAQARATKIAESTGQGVGTVRSASMGVVQVLPVGSTEISDYGAYDTQSIEKEVMVTVKAVFGVE